jgi:hypothetical protein
MSESSILQRLYDLERETGHVEFHYDEILQSDPASGFALAVLVASDLVLINDENKSIELSRDGRELSIDLYGSGVDIEDERNKMLQEAAHIDLTGVWADA